MNLAKIKEEISILKRGYQTVYKIDKDIVIYSILNALLGVISPYTTIYLTSRLINGIVQRKGMQTLLFYAGLIVGINLIVSAIMRLVSKKVNAARHMFWPKKEIYFSSVNMSMQYEHLENPETRLKKERMLRAEDAMGHGLCGLIWNIEGPINRLVSIIVSVSLTLHLFLVPGVGSYTGFLGFMNSIYASIAMAVLIILNLLIDNKLIQKALAFEFENIGVLVESNQTYLYYQELIDDYNAAAELRVFEQRNLIEEKWIRMITKRDYLDKIIRYSSRQRRIRGFVSTIMSLSLYLFIGAKAYMGAFGIGNFVLYTGTIEKFINAMAGLAGDITTLLDNNKHLREVFAYIDMPNNMYQGTLHVEKRAFCDEGDNDYEIEFRDVSFKYPASETYALRHVNMKFKIGEKMAVVGENGSGKTTFIKLLCRLYDPTEGKILLNGIDIKNYDYDEYLSIFSVVFQDFNLFAFSLGQNVATSVEYDEKFARECLEKAGFGERLASMPKGLETCLYKDFEKDGVEISGGEAQKIALARALYKNAPFIVLDEPTAALDPVAEYEIYSKFNELVGDKTAIYISHRLSSCRFCNDIAVFQNGTIVQRGSHDELIENTNGKYRELWNAQAQYYVAE